MEVLIAYHVPVGFWLCLGTLLAASVTTGVVAVRQRRQASIYFAGLLLYALGLAALGLGELQRGYAPAKFFVWGGVCEWAGFVLVAALLGWALRRIKPVVQALAGVDAAARSAGAWFPQSQALLAAATAVLAGWITLDFTFDGMGEGIALLGWSGRRAGCPAALMLVGAAIVMAWQSDGVWRAGWQYAALAAGVLFTSSLGWARLDAAVVQTAGDSPWLHRSVNLLISVSMMTVLTRFGLARVLPGDTDWTPRARRATPVFGSLALLMAAVVLLQEFWLLGSSGAK